MRKPTLSILVFVLVSCLASISCTNADNVNKITNANKVVTTVPTPISTPITAATPDPSFNLPYEALKDTAWISNPNPTPGVTPKKGTVAKGTKVFFDHVAPVTPTWQLAMFEDGSKKYVHPDDFKKL